MEIPLDKRCGTRVVGEMRRERMYSARCKETPRG